MRNGFKFLNQVESKTSQFEIVFKSFKLFSAQSREKGSFSPHKLRKFGDKSLNSLATKKLFKILAVRAGEYGPPN